MIPTLDRFRSDKSPRDFLDLALTYDNALLDRTPDAPFSLVERFYSAGNLFSVRPSSNTRRCSSRLDERSRPPAALTVLREESSCFTLHPVVPSIPAAIGHFGKVHPGRSVHHPLRPFSRIFHRILSH